MALWDTLKGQLRSVIEWSTASSDHLFELWSADGDEIKNASKLIIKPGQGAIFMYQGRIEDVHLHEGLYDLRTANIPFWTTVSRFMQRFESEHKVGIYFFWTSQLVNQKWGTRAVIKYDDPVYKFPVGLRAHGNFSFRVARPEFFFINVVGSRPIYTVEEARLLLADRFVQQLTDLLAEAGLSYAEVDKNRNELATSLLAKISPVLEPLGFELTDFRIENTDFDQETQQRIARIADMTAGAEAARRAGLTYAQMEQLGALRDAAKNEGGLAGAGVGLGAGLGLGQSFAAGMQGAVQSGIGQSGIGQAGISQAGAAAAAAGPAATLDHAARLKALKEMLDQQLISQEEFEKKKAEILSSL